MKWIKGKKHHEIETKSCQPWNFQESAKVTDETISKIINNQQDFTLGQFTQNELEVLTKIKNRKVVGLDEIPLEVWKTGKFDDILLWYTLYIWYMLYITKTQ